MNRIEKFLVQKTVVIRRILSAAFVIEAGVMVYLFTLVWPKLTLAIATRNVVDEYNTVQSNYLGIALLSSFLLAIVAVLVCALISSRVVFKSTNAICSFVATLPPIMCIGGWEHSYINITGFLMLFVALNPPIYQQKSPSRIEKGSSEV